MDGVERNRGKLHVTIVKVLAAEILDVLAVGDRTNLLVKRSRNIGSNQRR